jgi:hypothetical protein
MRRAANIDRNQTEIVSALRKCGVEVQALNAVGSGCPDLLCGFRGKNVLLEIKSDNDQLNKMQTDWHSTWPGQVATVWNFTEAMDAVLEACS